MKTLAASLLLCLAASRANAQPAVQPLEASIGLEWAAGNTFSTVSANETSETGGSFQLFTSQSRFDSVIGVDGSVLIRVRPWLQAGIAGSYSRPRLATHLANDFEDAPSIDAAERTLRFTLQAAIVAHLVRWHLGSRITPVIVGGGGYLRALDEGRTIAKNGSTYYLGAGMRYGLKRSGRLGLQADARAIADSGGLSLDDRTRVRPAFGASIFVRF